MKLFLQRFIPFLWCVGLAPFVVADGERPAFIVITSSQFPVEIYRDPEAASVIYHDLDAVAAIERQISQHLPADENLARTQLTQHIDEVGEAAFNAALIKAYQPLMTAIRYRIDRIPAVIVNDEAVVYGVTDLSDVHRRYLSWKGVE